MLRAWSVVAAFIVDAVVLPSAALRTDPVNVMSPKHFTQTPRSFRVPTALAAAWLLSTGCAPGSDPGSPADTDLAQAQLLLSSPAIRQAVTQSTSYLLSLRGSLGLGSAHNFRPRSAVTDELGQTHVRVDQTYRGVRVWEGEAIVAVSAESATQGLISELRAGIDVSTQPTLSSSEAISIAHSDLAPQGEFARPPSSELVVYPHVIEQVREARLRGPQGELNAEDIERRVSRYALAYHVHTELENGAQETQHTDFLIDAHSGEIVKRWSTLYTAASKGSGKSQYSGTVELGTDSNGTAFELRDVARSMNITTYNLNHGTSGTGTVFSDADNTWGDGKNYVSGGSTTNDNGQTAGVDAHYGTERTFDYYQAVHGRNGIDGAGKAAYNRVHYSSNYDNAFWSDGCFCMTYGDGRSLTVLTSIDVAGHEMTHGVISRTANLTYSGESGGLNEAMADIHGTMVEFYSRGGSGATIGNTGGNWQIGEQLMATPLRYMIKPSKDGQSRDAWSSSLGSIDVHFSSGPLNRAFYFLSQGASKTSTDEAYSSYLPGGMTGIGNDKAARIAYRALSTKMTASTNYAGARTAFLAAATDLYSATSAEYAAVQNAFAAINVGTPAGGGGGDTKPPSTALSAPTAGATLTGAVTVSATASDDVGVTKVEFYAGTTLIGSDSSAPYSVTWNTGSVGNGTYSLTSKAYDAAGNSATSTAVSVRVNNAAGSCSSTAQLLQNPGFESGATGWTASAGVIDNRDPDNAHSGAWTAWFLGYGSPHTDTLYQQVSIPAAACSATVSFWLAIVSSEVDPVDYDTLTVTVRDTAGKVLGTLATYSNVNEGDFTQKTFDLSAYKGKTVRLHFSASEDTNTATSFFVDDLALDVKQ